VTTLTDPKLLDGPWDLTINDQGDKAQVFVSNVLNGVVTRIDLTIPKGGDPMVTGMTQIASGYLFRTDPTALVVGPTGLAYDPKSGTLYVASTGDNEIFGISHAKDRTSDAGMGSLVYQDNAHLRGPLGLALAPNGDLITSNGDAVNPDPTQTSELVEFTPKGQFVGEFSIDAAAGGAFGLAVTNAGGLLRLAAVDDNTNSLNVWTFQTGHKSSEDDSEGDDSQGDNSQGDNSQGDNSQGHNSQEGDVAAHGSPAAGADPASTSTGSGSQTGTSADLMASPPGANASADATSRNHKGVDHHFDAVRAHHLRSALFGHRSSRGHKNHHVMTG
jgi:hypothetical protein